MRPRVKRTLSIYQSLPGDHDSANTLVPPNCDDLGAPYDVADPAYVRVIQDDVDPAATDVVDPASSGDGDPVTPSTDAPKRGLDRVIPSAGAPMTSHA